MKSEAALRSSSQRTAAAQQTLQRINIGESERSIYQLVVQLDLRGVAMSITP